MHDLPGADSAGTDSRILSNGRRMSEYYAPFPPNFFGPKLGDEKLDVAIIGAGVAGLTAATALLQCGHNVEIFEKSEFANEIGAAISTCPNASRILAYYEFDFDRALPADCHEFVLLNAHNLDTMRSVETTQLTRLYGYPWILYHRVDLHSELKRMATVPRPSSSAVAKIHLMSEVTDCDLDRLITFQDGTKAKKDLVVVADGIRTTSAAKVVEETAVLRAVPTGTAVYRFLVPTRKLLSDEHTERLFPPGNNQMVIAPHGDVRLVWYPCRRGAIMNFGLFHPDKTEGLEDEVWNLSVSWDAFQKCYRSLHPDLQAICAKAETLRLWRLCERRMPIETLTRGNVVLVGDAAHPMLPHQAQGAAMAIEDAAALGVLFSGITSKDEISERLSLFQKLRIDRVTAMQIFSSVGQDEYYKIADRVRPYVQGPLPETHEEYYDYNFTPNVLRDAWEMLCQFREGRDQARA